MAGNLYIDTRGCSERPVTFTEAVVNGLAEGGGLYVPETIPHLSLDDILSLADMSYAQRGAYIYRAFDIDLPSCVVDMLMDESYGNNFDDRRICPITSLNENTHVLELWHGPTSAFKDMALQCLPRFFAASAHQLRDQGKIDDEFLILVATSGDTGKAALEGFCDQPGTSIAVLYPDGGVSDIQFKQMATQRGKNVYVWGVHGNFDNCQTGAKNVFGDKNFEKKLHDEYGIALSSANSINWGRLLPQIVYYVSAYAQLVADGKLHAGDKLDVCVPTGNFGNILAAYYAKCMGVPIDTLFCASNENCVLTDFITSGTYDISNRKFVLTPSPSMDILVSSNLERQLFELTDRDGATIAAWMNDLRKHRQFKVDENTFRRMQEIYRCDFIDNETCLKTIKCVFDTYNYLIDPHTAVAFGVAEKLRKDNPVLIVSTAHWAKFGTNVYRALHNIKPNGELPEDVASLSGCALNKVIAQGAGIQNIPEGLSELDNLPVRFTEVIDNQTADIEEAIVRFLDTMQNKDNTSKCLRSLHKDTADQPQQ